MHQVVEPEDIHLASIESHEAIPYTLEETASCSS